MSDTQGSLSDMARDDVPLEDRIRSDYEAGLGYRELAKKHRLSFREISRALHGQKIDTLESKIFELKNAKTKLENEIGYMKTSLDKINTQYREYLSYKPLFEAVEAIKKEGGPKNHLIRVWFDHLRRSGVSDQDIDMFLKRKKLRRLEAELSGLRSS
ncbi:unnamed protein product [marine sediment metagenome]|uniref:Uncharacterized protein n=1 Tax=marine sediment metagenome TaxID=412755 RepID=X1JUG6_9ZZZZ